MEKKIKVKSCDKDENLNGAIIIYEIMPGRPTKYVTEERLQEVVNEAVVSIRKDMVTEARLQEVVNEAVVSIRKDMVTHEELQEAVVSIRKDMITEERLQEVVNGAIARLEERMTKLILSLKNNNKVRK